MATYTELNDFFSSPTAGPLRTKCSVALQIKASEIAATPTSVQTLKDWAEKALGNPYGYTDPIFRFVVCDNDTLTIAQIAAATDSAVQAAVNKAIDALYGS